MADGLTWFCAVLLTAAIGIASAVVIDNRIARSIIVGGCVIALSLHLAAAIIFLVRRNG